MLIWSRWGPPVLLSAAIPWWDRHAQWDCPILHCLWHGWSLQLPRYFIRTVFGQKDENAGIVFKSLTHICESREWICHFSSTVLRLLHVLSHLDVASPSVQALWEKEEMKWELSLPVFPLPLCGSWWLNCQFNASIHLTQKTWREREGEGRCLPCSGMAALKNSSFTVSQLRPSTVSSSHRLSVIW